MPSLPIVIDRSEQTSHQHEDGRARHSQGLIPGQDLVSVKIAKLRGLTLELFQRQGNASFKGTEMPKEVGRRKS